jgi:hypothetical protein
VHGDHAEQGQAAGGVDAAAWFKAYAGLVAARAPRHADLWVDETHRVLDAARRGGAVAGVDDTQRQPRPAGLPKLLILHSPRSPSCHRLN